MAQKKLKQSPQTGGDLDKPHYDIIYGSATNNDMIVTGALKEDPHCINNQDPETLMTALHWTGANRNLRIAEILFAQTAVKVDPWLKDKWGRLPMDLAQVTGNPSLIDLFHRKMFPEDYQYDFDPLDPPEGIIPVITPKFGAK